MDGALNLERLSRDVACAAISLAMTESREDEACLREQLAARGISSAAADYGGAFDQSVMKVVERAIIAARRENLPVVKSPCPMDKTSERQKVKELIAALEKDYPNLRGKITGAMQRGNITGW